MVATIFVINRTIIAGKSWDVEPSWKCYT